MHEYRLKVPCKDFTEVDSIRERVDNEMLQKLRDKGTKFEYLRTSAMFDPLHYECIVKVEVF